MKTILKIAVTAVVCLWCGVVDAQVPIQKSTEKVRLNGKMYYVHTAKHGETLFSMSRVYGVTVQQIIDANPVLTAGLKEGQNIRIPANGEGHVTVVAPPATAVQLPPAQPAEKPAAPAVQPAADTTVMSETVDSLRKIPVYVALKNTAAVPQPLLRPLNVALMLPLVRDIADTLMLRAKNPENFHAFYQGALLAVETLKAEGLSLHVSVFNTFYESDVAALVARGDLANFDMIIGPVYTNNLKPVAEFAKAHHIKIISPLDPAAETLTTDNPYFFQVSPPVYCRQKKLTDDILRRENVNIVVIYESGGRDSLMVEEYKQLLGVDSLKLLAHQVVRGIAVRDTLQQLLTENKMNCVLVASNNDAVVADVTANLYLFTLRNQYRITLYGTERWRNFETVDLNYLHTLNLHLAVPFFVDYDREQVKQFVARFYEVYHTDASQYAFQGYDTFYYFVQALMRYGKEFEHYLSHHHPPLLQTDYHFKYDGSYANGLVNVESCLIHYTPDYRIVKR
jgi:LysM repeat protein